MVSISYIITVSQSNAGGGIVSFTPADDAVLTGLSSNGQMILSGDPSATYSGFVSTPTQTGVIEPILIILTGTTQIISQLKIPINSGKTLFVAFKSAGLVSFYLEPVS